MDSLLIDFSSPVISDSSTWSSSSLTNSHIVQQGSHFRGGGTQALIGHPPPPLESPGKVTIRPPSENLKWKSCSMYIVLCISFYASSSLTYILDISFNPIQCILFYVILCIQFCISFYASHSMHLVMHLFICI